jgi:hypothetical protein
MKIRLGIIAALLIATPPVVAQDLPTDQLERHADVVRQDSLLRSNLRQSRARQNRGSASRAAANQAIACANRARFSREYGANHPQVRRLHALCARAGY